MGDLHGRLRESCGGVFNNYAILQGVDQIVPVDIYVPGCPPNPDALIYAINQHCKRRLTANISAIGMGAVGSYR